MSAPITVALYTRTLGAPEMRAIDGGLKAMQALVGGWIETVYLPEGLVLVCNEEGRLQGLPAHHAALFDTGVGQIIVGDFFVCRFKGEEFASLREGDLAKLRQYVRPV